MRELLAKYDRPAPRYTSYPTAPHFKDIPGQGYYRGLLKAVPENHSVSLYIHIPFCRHLCLYCGCNTKVVDHQAPVREYLAIVQQEIALAAAAIGRRQKVSHIHFGGGTPNFAPADGLGNLLQEIAKRFTLSESAVIAMEMDPRILSREKTQELVKLGVNRVSLGVQDFQPDVQQAVNRIQPYGHVQDCVGWLREAGINSINFDMIYGLPLQTSAKIHDNMEKLKQLKPDRVALFGYAHVPWFKEHQKKLEAYRLPDTFERFEMAELARHDLIKAGYVPVGIDHFALPGDVLARALKEKRLHRNFQGYTADHEETLIAFGQTSISQYGGAYVQNTDSNREYRDKVINGEFPVVKSCPLSSEDIYRRAVIESIMCYGEVDLLAMDEAQQWADLAWEAALPALAGFAADGLVKLGDMDVAVTPTGRPLTRLIAGAFDARLPQAGRSAGAPRHARAV
jgi:oxygen-independent coproporphyrinogen-3 oxidase